MAAFAGAPGPEQRMRKRHISLSAESPAAPHEVRVAAGTATVLLFDSPLLPASLELATARQRFERIDLTGPILGVVMSAGAFPLGTRLHGWVWVEGDGAEIQNTVADLPAYRGQRAARIPLCARAGAPARRRVSTLDDSSAPAPVWPRADSFVAVDRW